MIKVPPTPKYTLLDTVYYKEFLSIDKDGTKQYADSIKITHVTFTLRNLIKYKNIKGNAVGRVPNYNSFLYYDVVSSSPKIDIKIEDIIIHEGQEYTVKKIVGDIKHHLEIYLL